ncbi:BadF-type ATPase [Tenacibaculum sp. MAR_2009_124]|uniref:BadF/BadG/BcrA/BcrD ATPase family protein n=1 Tax=Tenacibaculum sp. MAR_2009_124 TaxID=1250059 RepID=UPI0008951646|nr:BadF/BadG/BcrA/BcrD ATPase family protein [Tenacibaculum sp. MAR_2009_124]SEB71042.1 BadF-type ATPase [Tenacibaculum sp. MAR_2009_124]
MILIADSGSTKCDWILLNENDNTIVNRIRTNGVNPSVLKKKNIKEVIANCDELNEYKGSVSSIYFFGAGCNNAKGEDKIRKVFSDNFPVVEKIVVKEDLMLAVFAASQDASVVCILGTGSNCCFYNGEEIDQRVKAMGYILMDEGSGNHLGKEVLKGYYYKDLPEDLKFSLEKEFQLDDDRVLSKLYGAKMPNKYLAQYARFLFENIEHPYAKNIVIKCISEFIDKQLVKYKDELGKVPLYFIGSVGYHARDIIKEELEKRGFRAPENFIRRPLTAFIQSVKEDKAFLSKVV